MKDQTVWLNDYTPFPFLIENTRLEFHLSPRATRVQARIRFVPRGTGADLELHGTDLRLLSARIDGQEVAPTLTETGLRIAAPDHPFTWECEVEIAPEDNHALEGLYMSNGMYCTQCEAEGFRRITFYPDRPDVMAPFSVRIESDLPVLLSNGEETARGPGWAEWDDPWPKPAYLFGLVAGDLHATTDSFTTMEGRDVALNIWVRDGDQDKTGWAMESLKASMAWDEQKYGRAYDLNVFNIVAVDDFNAGAMENKGLNIFNAALVLASADTATDAAFERIESVIAHEYFHNWTGNRITCRDWFQLCLKEGLTVFRDQQFSADMRSAAVKRIEDTIGLRAHQFREDAGPLAHPVRPESFVEINNFYTATVYEKGAELIGMLKTLVGDDAYAQALDLYFARHDGQACTIEDWLKVFEDTTKRDLSQFKRWYEQAGTPTVSVSTTHENGSLAVTLRQSTPATPGQPDKRPMVIPFALGVLDQNGTEILPTRVVELTSPEQTLRLDIPESASPVLSLNRGFSAPVHVDTSALPDGRAVLLAHDTDPFARWEAARSLSKSALITMITQGAAPDPLYIDGIGQLIADSDLDPAYRALCLALPGEDDLAQTLSDAGQIPDPEAIRTALRAMRAALATHLGPVLERLFDTHQVAGPYSPSAKDAGARALANSALALLTLTDKGARAEAQFDTADNMTQSLAALAALLRIGKGAAQLDRFETRWRENRLVMDGWFSMQLRYADPSRATELAQTLMARPDYDRRTPNRVRAVIAALAGNHAALHHETGQAYDLIADEIMAIDPENPQLAARLTTIFQSWKRYDSARQTHMRAALTRIANMPGLSRDTAEMASRLLPPAKES